MFNLRRYKKMMKNEQQNNWEFLPVHKSRVLKELEKAKLILIDFNVTTILPNVFKRAKETEDFIFYSLPNNFKVNIRVSTQNAKTRRYEHNDMEYEISKLLECGLDKPYEDVEKGIEEKVGESVEPVNDDLPF